MDHAATLRDVIAEPLCDVSKGKIDQALNAYAETVIKARLAFKTFRVVENYGDFRQLMPRSFSISGSSGISFDD